MFPFFHLCLPSQCFHCSNLDQRHLSLLALDLKKLTRPHCFSDGHKRLNSVPATVRFCGALVKFCGGMRPPSPIPRFHGSIIKGIIFQCEVMNILPVHCPGHRTFATAGPQCSCHTHLDQPEQWSVQPQHSRRSHSAPNIMDNV